MNARVAKESIEHVCNILAFFGVRVLNPESFRLAKAADDKVVKVVVLNVHNFRIRLTTTPTFTPDLQRLVTYALYRYKLPFHLQSKSNYLLLAFGFLLNHVDLFSKYDSFFTSAPTGMTTLESLNSEASSFIQGTSLLPSEPSWNSILCLHRRILSELRETYSQIYYTSQIISKIHDSDPSLDPEDIWISSTEERIQNYASIMAEAEKTDQRKEEEFKLRANFWKWVEGVVDTVEDSSENHAAEACPVDFAKVVQGLENNFRFISSVWQGIEEVVQAIDSKMKAVVRDFPEAAEEFERVFQEMAAKLPTFDQNLEKTLKTGEIPNLVPLFSSLVKERGEADIALALRAESLLSELSKAQSSTKLAVFKLMKNVPGVKTYNI